MGTMEYKGVGLIAACLPGGQSAAKPPVSSMQARKYSSKATYYCHAIHMLWQEPACLTIRPKSKQSIGNEIGGTKIRYEAHYLTNRTTTMNNS